jgi:hypothetical protein
VTLATGGNGLQLASERMVSFFIEPLNPDHGFQKLNGSREGKCYKNLKNTCFAELNSEEG